MAFVEALVIVLGGVVVSYLMVIVLVTHQRRRLTKNMEHLHGSARWATAEDVEATGLLGQTDGVYVGGWPDKGFLHYLRHNGPEHVLAFAPTRSGKGISLVIPTLLAWKESCVVYDIKGENWAKTAGWRASVGQTCYKFSPVEPTGGSRFNPLAEIRLNTERDVSDAHNIAEILVRTGNQQHMAIDQHTHFQDAAVSLTTGMILHVCYLAERSGAVACLADVAHTFTRPGINFQQTLKEMLTADHTTYGTHPVVAEKAQEMLDKDIEELSGVLSTAKTALSVYSDPMVARNTAVSDFSVQDLVNAEAPASLYIVVPPSDKQRLRRLTRLIFTIIVNRLTERLEFAGVAQHRNRHRLLFLIDEFPSLEYMQIFADALSYMAGYGLKAYLFAQDIRQIVDAYGHNESIVSNCHVRVAFAPNQFETAELLSKMTGVTTVEKADLSFSGKRLATTAETVMATATQIERPLMTADEVMRLEGPQKEGSGAEERITEPGEMLIFSSGAPAILGRQMLYFKDPELFRRSQIPPPEPEISVEAHPVQRPLDPPEILEPNEFAWEEE
jgi:type IV secretion system protein VirD4